MVKPEEVTREVEPEEAARSWTLVEAGRGNQGNDWSKPEEATREVEPEEAARRMTLLEPDEQH